MGDEDTAIFGSLVFGLVSIVIAVFVIGIAIANFRATADAIVQYSTSGVARIKTVASSLVSQAFAIIQSAGPEIESTASAIGSTVIDGVKTGLNAVLSVGNSLLQALLNTFATIANLIKEFGQQLVQLFIDNVGPMFQNLKTGFSVIMDNINISLAMYQSVSDVLTAIINVIGGLVFPSF
jgi:hypothetical protein